MNQGQTGVQKEPGANSEGDESFMSSPSEGLASGGEELLLLVVVVLRNGNRVLLDTGSLFSVEDGYAFPHSEGC